MVAQNWWLVHAAEHIDGRTDILAEFSYRTGAISRSLRVSAPSYKTPTHLRIFDMRMGRTMNTTDSDTRARSHSTKSLEVLEASERSSGKAQSLTRKKASDSVA